MKVIFPYAYYYPETCAGLFIADDVMHHLAECGVQSLLTVPTPSRNVPPDAIWNYDEYQSNKMIHIHRFKMYKEGRSPLLRALRYFFCECIQLHFLLWEKYNVAFIDSTPPIQGLKMPILKLLKKVPIVYNAQDIFPDSLVGTGLTKNGSLIWKIGCILEKITYKYSDKIIVISEDFKNNLLSKGVSEDKIAVVYNWVDEKAVVDVPRDRNKLFDKYRLDREKFYITYSGNIGLTQNMDMLLEVMEELLTEAPEIRLVLIGEGAYKKKVDAFITSKNLSNVILLPFQPFEDLSYVFSLGDAGLIISKPGVGANSVPSKTWNIMSASRPVLANFDENELKAIITDNNCGIFTKAGDKLAFKDAILKLYYDREFCKEMGKNGRQFVMENLTKAVGTQKYIDVINSVAK